MKEFADIVSQLGFPIAVVVWMFWRDYVLMDKLTRKLQQVIDLLGVMAARKE